MISKKEISVIIATFDRINVVLDLLNDFTKQTFKSFEILIYQTVV